MASRAKLHEAHVRSASGHSAGRICCSCSGFLAFWSSGSVAILGNFVACCATFAKSCTTFANQAESLGNLAQQLRLFLSFSLGSRPKTLRCFQQRCCFYTGPSCSIKEVPSLTPLFVGKRHTLRGLAFSKRRNDDALTHADKYNILLHFWPGWLWAAHPSLPASKKGRQLSR